MSTVSIAMLGTRGVPAAYGGFETAVEEIGTRLVDMGFLVTVFNRIRQPFSTYRGMRVQYLPALRRRSLETFTHSAISSFAPAIKGHDVAFVFNAANAPFLPVLKARGLRTALHVDGLEWKRAKWGRTGRTYYRLAEKFATRWADLLVCDSRAIQKYYVSTFGVSPEFIPYGASLLDVLDPPRHLAPLGLTSDAYHLVVARMEPENNVHLAIQGYLLSNANLPLVVVGGSPYSTAYNRDVKQLASASSSVRLIGPVADQSLLDELYAHCRLYIHGHSVGGTNPSLLRAMGAGCSIVALDVPYAREVLGDTGSYFDVIEELARFIENEESTPSRNCGKAARQRVADLYRWDDVAIKYADLARRLTGVATIHE